METNINPCLGNKKEIGADPRGRFEEWGYSIIKMNTSIQILPLIYVSWTDSIFMRVASEYIDIQVQPFITKFPLYIKDTCHILRELDQVEQQDRDFLITSDVKSYYRIIEHEKGVQAFEAFLQQDTNINENRTSFITKCVEFVQNNYFWFHNNFYLQKKGEKGYGLYISPRMC